jgi:signal transduction histidine kinase
MHRFRLLKADTEIYFVFVILIATAMFSAVYCSRKIEDNREITSRIVTVETPSIETLGQLQVLITQSRLYATNIVYLPKTMEERQQLRELVAVTYPRVKARINGLMYRWDDTWNIPRIHYLLLRTEKLLDEELALLKQPDAGARLENSVLPLAALITNDLQQAIASERENLEELHRIMQTSYRNLQWSIVIVAMGIVVIVLLSAFYMVNNMILPVMKLKEYITRISKGEIPDIRLQVKNNAVGQMTDAVRMLTDNFRTTAHFAYEIGEGKFDAYYTRLGEHDEMGNALIHMRDKLSRAQRELTEYMKQLQLQNDILQQARHELFDKACELEQANKYKSEFLANMSHELRTPLNSILVLANILCENRKGHLGEKETEYARIIHRSGSDLLLLINDILDLSKIEAGRIDLVMESVRIETLKAEALSLFDEIAKERKIHFGVEVTSSLPDSIRADRLRLAQVIRNLLSNAFKFTAAGGEVVLRFRSAIKNSNACLEISVQDNGIGIPSEKQAMIFEAFRQADGSISRKYGGTGLGLSISRMLVGMMGGSLDLVSQEGAGSTFFVVLPLAAAAGTAGEERQAIVVPGDPVRVQKK